MSAPDTDFLASFSGPPAQYWPRLNQHGKAVFHAEAACILLHPASSPPEAMQVLAQDHPATLQRVVQQHITSAIAQQAPDSGDWFEPVAGALVVSLPGNDPSIQLWLVLFGAATLQPEAAVTELRLLVTTYYARRGQVRSEQQVLGLSEALDLGLDIGQSTRFQEAAVRLCHRIAGTLGAVRVSLSWRPSHGADLKLQATSHGARINVDTQEAEALTRLMDEAADQNNEVSHPTLPGSHAINREHQAYSKARQDSSVLSLPLRDSSATDTTTDSAAPSVHGVLTAERSADDGRWQDLDLDKLRLALDLITPRLRDLHAASGWWGKRLWLGLKKRAASLLGIRHTGWKLAGLGLIATLAALAFIKVDHRVRAPFLLKTEAASIAAAPFAGYIDQVNYHLGDIIQEGQTLLTLDRRELLLDQANGLASRDKHDREARSLEAQSKLAEALMSKAERRQDDARLAIVEHRLSKTEIRAPFTGVAVEGDLRERLNAPVQLGEPLVKIVQLKDLYGQLQVDERDIGYLRQGMIGELAFASRPSEKFAVQVERYEPVAEVHEEGNVFLLRVKVLAPAADWWRPGMSGLCKISIQPRSLLWILSHRTWEAARLWLWW